MAIFAKPSPDTESSFKQAWIKSKYSSHQFAAPLSSLLFVKFKGKRGSKQRFVMLNTKRRVLEIYRSERGETPEDEVNIFRSNVELSGDAKATTEAWDRVCRAWGR